MTHDWLCISLPLSTRLLSSSRRRDGELLEMLHEHLQGYIVCDYGCRIRTVTVLAKAAGASLSLRGIHLGEKEASLASALVTVDVTRHRESVPGERKKRTMERVSEQ